MVFGNIVLYATGVFLDPKKIADSITSATPLTMYRNADFSFSNTFDLGDGKLSLVELFLGFRMGSIGESAIIFIIIAGIALTVTKVANWRPMLSTLIAALLTTVIFYYLEIIQKSQPYFSPKDKDILTQMH